MIIGIDPGPVVQTIVLFDGIRVLECHDFSIVEAIAYLVSKPDYLVVCEWIDSYGMPVGSEVFQTVFNIGRMFQAFGSIGGIMRRVPRRDIKQELCNNAKAKDSNIRAALLIRVGPVGTVKAHGPCFGVSNHRWAALAAAVTGYTVTATKNEVIGSY